MLQNISPVPKRLLYALSLALAAAPAAVYAKSFGMHSTEDS